MKRLTTARMACVLSVLPLLLSLAQAQVHDERAVKAAFVYNLTKYVEWPEPSNDMVIGFVGEGSMGEVLKGMLDGKTSESRTIHVLLSPADPELEHCMVLYIADPSPKKMRAALDRVRNKNILTVGETESFVRDGGMIGLVTVGDHVQIQVSLEVTRESRLKISSRLLSIAAVIQPTSVGRD